MNAFKAAPLALPKQSIAWIVARMHVGESDEYVKTDIRRRCTTQGWTETMIERAEKYAVQCHRKNQALYRSVMSGRF